MRIVLSNASALWGGVHTVTQILATGLQARGHEVELFCRPDSELERELCGRVPCVPILKGPDLGPLALWRCLRALRRFSPDLVLALMTKDVRLTGPAARALGVPLVIRRPGNLPLKDDPFHRLLYGWMPAHHIANSEATRLTMLASAPWLEPSDVTAIHNGIDPTPFEAAAPVELGLPEGALVFGFLGRFEHGKGLLDLADAWPTVAAVRPEAHLVIGGKGRVLEKAQARFAEAPRVHWAGYRTDVPAFLAAMDVVVMPSHQEGFGLVAVEAMAAGKPVIATPVGGLAELLSDGVEGRFVPSRDPVRLARAMVDLGGDAALRERMAEAGRRRVRQAFTVERMLDAYEALLLRVIEQAGRDRL